MKSVEIYTDGSCEPNPGPGGWGYVILENGYEDFTDYGGAIDTTNNRMEIMAVIEAMNQFEYPVEATIYSDSKYVVNGITSWVDGWERNNYKDGTIKNRDLWMLISDHKTAHNIKAKWVPAHMGVKYNEQADRLAEKGRLQLGGVSRVEPNVRTGIYIDVNNHDRKDVARLKKYLKRNKWEYTS